jgi:hypothetical protein
MVQERTLTFAAGGYHQGVYQKMTDSWKEESVIAWDRVRGKKERKVLRRFRCLLYTMIEMGLNQRRE